MKIFIGLIFAYLLGSIPTAYLFGKLYKGIDIREHGSGNVGATNVFRVLGKRPGIFVLCFDILKGVLAVVLVGNILGLEDVLYRILLGFVAVGGHNWTVFLNFKGGKGVASSLGVLIGLTIQFPVLRMVVLICVLVWIVIFLASGYVSLASMIAATILPFIMLLTNQSFEMVILGVVFCLFVVIRHKANIKRLLAGEESRVKLPFFCKNK